MVNYTFLIKHGIEPSSYSALLLELKSLKLIFMIA